MELDWEEVTKTKMRAERRNTSPIDCRHGSLGWVLRHRSWRLKVRQEKSRGGKPGRAWPSLVSYVRLGPVKTCLPGQITPGSGPVRGTTAQRRGHTDTEAETVVTLPQPGNARSHQTLEAARKGPSPEPADTLGLDYWLPARWEDRCLSLNPPVGGHLYGRPSKLKDCPCTQVF